MSSCVLDVSVILLILNGARSLLFPHMKTSARKAQRAVMSFSALPLFGSTREMHLSPQYFHPHAFLSPLCLLVYTEHNNAIMKGTGGGLLLLLCGICVKLQLSPGQLRLCIIKLCMFV